jgi:FixJ family two-component response regulator
MAAGKTDTEPVIYIVDDDESVRRALSRLLQSVGMRAKAFSSPAELLRHGHPGEPGCVLLDIRLPGMNGFELHSRMLVAGYRSPIIFITAHPEDRRNMGEAVDFVAFLEKPFDDRSLLGAIEIALDRCAKERGRPGMA